MDIVRLCLDYGAKNAEKIPVRLLVFQRELREYCEQNRCGRYARNYTCPPLVGEIEALIAKAKLFSDAIVWQNIYPLEDSFDFEGMMKAQEKHNKMTFMIAQNLYAELGRENVLVLSAGGCSLCEVCAAVDNLPCRHQNEALSSLEAYGINVSKIQDVSKMRYINGTNTVTYFAGALINSA